LEVPVQGGVVHVVGGKGEMEARGEDHWTGGGEQVEGALRAGAMVRGGRGEGEDQNSGSYGERYWLDICLHIAACIAMASSHSHSLRSPTSHEVSGMRLPR